MGRDLIAGVVRTSGATAHAAEHAPLAENEPGPTGGIASESARIPWLKFGDLMLVQKSSGKIPNVGIAIPAPPSVARGPLTCMPDGPRDACTQWAPET